MKATCGIRSKVSSCEQKNRDWPVNMPIRLSKLTFSFIFKLFYVHNH